MDGKIVATGITFDDVLLVPRHSSVVPAETDVSTRLTRGISLNIPIVSSPMDTVTESEMAIALAQEGGLGVIHKNLSIDRQAEEVDKVKRSANGIIMDPVTLPPTATVARAREVMDQYNISGVPITGDDRRLVGIITRRDLRFLESGTTPIAEIMTKTGLVTATGNVSLDEAEKILMANKVEKLLLVDPQGLLTGLITIKDIDMMKRFPNACKDRQGRLRVGAAVGVFDYDRAASLIAKGVDMLVVDSAHGHSANVIETVAAIKKRWEIEVVAGNVATREGWRGWSQSWDRSRVDLYHAGHLRRRRAPDHGGLGRGAGGGRRRRAGDRRRRHSLLGRHHQGDRRGSPLLHGRRAARGCGGEPGTDRPLPGTDVQGLPRHGIAGGDGPGVERTLPPEGDGARRRQIGAGGSRGSGALQGAAQRVRVSARRRPPGRDGLLRHADHRGTAARRAIHPGHRRIRTGKPSA
jgi:IMP dehydrogenase